MPSKNKRRSHDSYTRDDAAEFVKYLGCWRLPNQETALERRSDYDYLCLLNKLIEVNKTREPYWNNGRMYEPARWETEFAIAALAELALKLGIKQ